MAFYNAGNVANVINSTDTDDTNITDALTIIPLEKDSFGKHWNEINS